MPIHVDRQPFAGEQLQNDCARLWPEIACLDRGLANATTHWRRSHNDVVDKQRVVVVVVVKLSNIDIWSICIFGELSEIELAER